MSWREAARITARIARALDRLHAQGKVHGGIEPLTILFVGGTVRLADPLPPAAAAPAFQAPAVRAGEPADRQSDFYSLGRTMAAMLAGVPQAPPDEPPLPPPLLAVQRRLGVGDAGGGYSTGNDVAAALELAIAASEGFAAPPPPAVEPGTVAPPASPPPPPTGRPAAIAAAGAGRGRRRRPPALLGGLLAVLLLAGLAALWWWSTDEVVTDRPPAPVETAAPAPVAVPSPTAAPARAPASPGTPESAAPIPLEEVLAALPEVAIEPPPALPDSRARLEALLAEARRRPCSRLEVEPSAPGLRLVGSTATAADRAALLAAVGALEELERVTIQLDREGVHCRLYAMLDAHTTAAVPRLADLWPRRDHYRLAASEPLVIRVLTPDFPSHLMVDYFTADGMVVHLARPEAATEPLTPLTERRVGDPTDGPRLTIAEPFGHELILVIASRAPVFAEPRPQIEPADAYLPALDEALRRQAEPPIASTMPIETVPAAP